MLTLAAVLLTFFLGRRRQPLPATVGVCLLAATLIFYRTAPLAGISIAAPLGFSYLALRLISYLADVSRGLYPPETVLIPFLLNMTYLPAAFLGPIDSYADRKKAMVQRASVNWDTLSLGGLRVLWGLFKKLCVAARLAVVTDAVSTDPERFGGWYILLALAGYSLQLYADFSGGMDTVLGFSQMLGIRLSENFDRPFLAETVQEFWRRWHTTLGRWLRDYIYIPLGGNRKGALRRWLALLSAFAVSGIWHGGQYLLWGLLHGLLTALGPRLKTGRRFLNRAVTFGFVSLLWVFFLQPDTASALHMLGCLFSPGSASFGELGLSAGEWAVLVLSAAAMFPGEGRSCEKLGPARRTAVLCIRALIILVFGMYGIGFRAEAFIYSRF